MSLDVLCVLKPSLCEGWMAGLGQVAVWSVCGCQVNKTSCCDVGLHRPVPFVPAGMHRTGSFPHSPLFRCCVLACALAAVWCGVLLCLPGCRQGAPSMPAPAVVLLPYRCHNVLLACLPCSAPRYSGTCPACPHGASPACLRQRIMFTHFTCQQPSAVKDSKTGVNPSIPT